MTALLSVLLLAAAAPLEPPSDGSAAPFVPAYQVETDGGVALATDGGIAPTADGGLPESELAPALAPKHVDWLVIPLFTYNSDAKFGYGGAGQVQGAGGVDPYRYQLAAQILFYTGGVQSHWIHYDSPQFLGTKFRVWGRLEYHREKFQPYYGVGNDTSSNVNDYMGLSGSNPFTYDRIGPFIRGGVAYPVIPDLYLFGFAAYQDTTIHEYAGSLLEQQQPYGILGGHELELNVGFYYDTRDRQAVPGRGGLIEFSARGVDSALLSSFTYGGLDLKMLYFKTIIENRLVLALRAQGDALSNGTPFFELPNFGGVEPYDGVGGLWSQRGMPEDRYVARFKFIGTLELRSTLATFFVRRQPLNLGVDVFTDLGRVYQPGMPDGPFIHPAVGAGIRLWRRSFVLRVDVATSAERGFNLYLVFGNFF